MTVTAYPIAHNITFEDISDVSVPTILALGGGYFVSLYGDSWVSLIEDLSEHSVIGKSITFPALAQGEIAIGMFTAFSSRLEFDLKSIIPTPDYSDTFVFIIAIPEGATSPTEWIQCSQYVTADWSHVSQALSPTNYTFLIGGVRGSSGGEIQGWFDNIEIIPSLHLSSYPAGPAYIQAPCGELILSAETPDFAQGNDVSCGELTVTPYSPNFGTPLMPIPAGVLSLVGRPPSGIWSVQVDKLATAKLIYRCILTGAADGTTDLTLPMKSFQARLRDGDPSYLSCVIPDSTTYAASVAARTNGEIVIYSGYLFDDGTEQLEEIIRVDYESLQINRGANSDSLTVSGHKTITSSSPKDWTVTGVSFYGQTAEGKRRVRANLDPFVRCGDTCIYGTGENDYFIVGAITCWVTAKPAWYFMEVSEL